jgi:cytidylate kinase|tara:strand:+ start:201 stop:818 length:618 start_codon:yes stop_codon:yes gene_type:complete
MKFTVAIDGPAASGKGTISRRISEYFGFSYLDTGLIYRFIGLKVLSGFDPLEAIAQLNYDEIEVEGLRTEAVSKMASQIASDIKVRNALVEYQREFSRRCGGAVLDGRDIGTVICPNAEVKFYITASEEIRANRRFQELAEKDKGLTIEALIVELRARDLADKERKVSPLLKAEDAVLLDTTELSIDASVALAVNAISKVIRLST